MDPDTFSGAPLAELRVRPVERSEEARYQAQMRQYHYLGALPKIGETLWYVATWCEQWVAQLSLSAAALKCGVRDRFIGWDFRSQYGRVKLIANNSRFLSLPEGRFANVGSKVHTQCPIRTHCAVTVNDLAKELRSFGGDRQCADFMPRRRRYVSPRQRCSASADR